MKENYKNKRYNLIYNTIKIFFIAFIFFALINWLSVGKLYIIDVLMFSVWTTGLGIIPILIALKITTPEINKETKEERLRIFKDQNMAIKLIISLTITLAFFLMIMRILVPFYWLTFWNALAISLGIGLLISGLCTLSIRFIIQLENPPFQNMEKK